MVKGGTATSRLKRRLEKWLDECKMAASGIILATREWRFLAAFAISFVVFGTLMNLLSGSTAALNYFWMTDLSGRLQTIGEGFLAIFGIGRNFWDWILTFLIVVLQSILIGLVVLVWQKRRRHRREQIIASAKNYNNIQDAGLVTGLAILGSGCPTCGTTLLAPILSTFFSSSGYILGVVSGLLTTAAVILSLFALKRIGKDAFIMITAERYQKRHANNTALKEDKANE